MNSLNNNVIRDITLSNYIKLQIQYGSDIYDLLLSNKHKQIQVENLLDEIEKVIQVPKCDQTIIYKGQRLDDKPNANLNDLYIFNNSKLILSRTYKHKCYHISNHHNISKQTNNVQEEKLNVTIKSNNDLDHSSITKTETSFIFPKKQEINLNLNGFIPEPNKKYE